MAGNCSEKNESRPRKHYYHVKAVEYNPRTPSKIKNNNIINFKE